MDIKNKHLSYLNILLALILVAGLFGVAQYFLFTKERVADIPLQESIENTKPSASYSQKPLTNSLPDSLPSSLTTSASISTKPPLVIPPVEIVEIPPIIEKPLTFQDHLAIQAELRLQSDVTYDGSYQKIAYPMGDVPEHIGVCTDVVIRSFRALGIDLQERVHEDMKRNFSHYPKKWKLTRPDTNIDHRRVPNLMTYFKRAGGALEITENPFDYKAGNIVTWDLGEGLVHIGIVSKYVSEKTGNPLIIHNIGGGPQMNDMLFRYKITGHYKYGEDKTAVSLNKKV